MTSNDVVSRRFVSPAKIRLRQRGHPGVKLGSTPIFLGDQKWETTHPALSRGNGGTATMMFSNHNTWNSTVDLLIFIVIIITEY